MTRSGRNREAPALLTESTATMGVLSATESATPYIVNYSLSQTQAPKCTGSRQTLRIHLVPQAALHRKCANKILSNNIVQ